MFCMEHRREIPYRIGVEFLSGMWKQIRRIQNYYQNSIVEVDRVYIASFIMVAIMCMLPVPVRDTHFLS